MARKQRAEDATVWIGYADFLTTLAVLFFVLMVGIAAKLSSARPGYVRGVVLDADRATPLSGCAADIGAPQADTTDATGSFDLTVDSIRAPLNVGLTLICKEYDTHRTLVQVEPGKTRLDTTRLRRRKDDVVRVDTLPGDALFEPNQYILKTEAIDTIISLGKGLKARLASDEVVAVQGHTDDVPFPAGAGKDNWMLSGERAAAAARILTDPIYGVAIPECQVTIMGFGPSRPAVRVRIEDLPEQKFEKRVRNRRIEFRRLHGPDISGGGCARSR